MRPAGMEILGPSGSYLGRTEENSPHDLCCSHGWHIFKTIPASQHNFYRLISLPPSEEAIVVKFSCQCQIEAIFCASRRGSAVCKTEVAVTWAQRLECVSLWCPTDQSPRWDDRMDG
jgi:hypothetical protein